MHNTHPPAPIGHDEDFGEGLGDELELEDDFGEGLLMEESAEQQPAAVAHDTRTKLGTVLDHRHVETPSLHEDGLVFDEDWSLEIDDEIPEKEKMPVAMPAEPPLSRGEMHRILLKAPIAKNMLSLWKDLNQGWPADLPLLADVEELNTVIQEEYINGIMNDLEKSIPEFVERKTPVLRNRYIRLFRKKNVMGKTVQVFISKKLRMEKVRDALSRAENTLKRELETAKNLSEREWLQHVLTGVQTVQKEHKETPPEDPKKLEKFINRKRKFLKPEKIRELEQRLKVEKRRYAA